MKKNCLYFCFLLILFLNGVSTLAGQNIVNGDFENAQFQLLTPFRQVIPGGDGVIGWSVESGNIDYIGSYWTPSSGNRSIDLNGSESGSISQSFATQIGKEYYIKFDFAGNPVCDSPLEKVLEVSVGSTREVYLFNTSARSINDLGWEPRVFTFTAVAAVSSVRFLSKNGGFCGPAIDNVELVDCAGVREGQSIKDECGECLEPTDINFNRICLDCYGVINGDAIVDDCGVCLPPSAPDFNNCLDCAGAINGSSIIDQCGQCVDSLAANFNECLDCAGIPFGESFFNECGQCYTPGIPINAGECDNRKLIYIPTSFSPNGDGINDEFKFFEGVGRVAEVLTYEIYNRWGGKVYIAANFDIASSVEWWDGTSGNSKLEEGVYIYVSQIAFASGAVLSYSGGVHLVR
ncbi:choice-of-anchor C family protein [Neolewinella lacunae]|uniref:Choice-of-anchor C family protein n=1 Tax=Neolewinella lacunae TaxID=1517758 RepID=A0A923PHI2_9BACT|nr:choice-of-anchor C family protein [Neolewinella lacunae]MBC6994172.1 choice-of-anchor C family protein [Neolewinella lacunae]MDN3636679.1 choice-of-anchor C family protein [Neolewinella lacunae]